MFKVVVNDGTQELPDDDVYYIVAKEGIFLKKKMGVMESIAPVDKISILESANTMARMYINPLPAQTGAKILEFFKAVYKEYHGEAIVLLFYNEETGKYRVVPPHQKVTSAACDYNRGVTIEGWTMIGTIHSHANFSAFHSGTDDDDEKTFDGLHITYGNVMSEEFSLSASIVANGHRFVVNPEDYMLGLTKTKDVDEKEVKYTTKIYKADPKTGKMVLDEAASSRSAYSTRKYDKRFRFNVSKSKRQFNPKWMDMVEKGTYVYTYGGYGGWRGGNYWQNRGQGYRGAPGGGYGWGGNYDPNAWKNAGRYIAPGVKKPLCGSGPGTPGVVVKSDEKTAACGSTNPCLSCKNRDIKIMNEMEGIEFEEEMYHCEKCNVVFTTTDDAPKCPKCKKDDHMVLIDEDDLKDNFEKGDPPILDDIDREAALNSAQSMNPDQQGYETCLECGNTFLMLASDECCPFCHTLLPDTVVASGPPSAPTNWECPHCQGVFTEAGMVNHNECPHCSGAVELHVENPNDKVTVLCPTCQEENTLASLESMGCCYMCHAPYSNGEIDREKQMEADSGAFLHQSDEEHQAILDAAAEADKNLERIPDPEKAGQSIPLAKESLTLIEKFKKVFGKGGGNDTVH